MCVKTIDFVDANCMIGRPVVQREGSLKNTEDLMKLMQDCGVVKALVYHSVARESDMLMGNSLLEQEIKGKDCFLKQWLVMPNIWEEFINPDVLLKQMRDQNVCSVRLLPKLYGYSLKRYASGELIDALTACKVPLFLEQSQLSSWDELYEFCQEYPKSKVVLCNTGYRCLRGLVPVLSACKNLYVETSTFLVHNGIKEFCRHFGAERMIFGAGTPEASMAAAVAQICYAEIAEEEKQLIASGNILNLLGEVEL